MSPSPQIIQVNRVAIFAATSWEAQAVLAAGYDVERTRLAGYPASMFPCADSWCYVIPTGIGLQRAGRVAKDVLADAKWDALISAGFAGSLQGAEVGSVVVGTRVAAVSGVRVEELAQHEVPCHPDLVHLACAQSACLGDPIACGAFISTDRVVWRAEDKQALSALYDAVAVDMESAALATVGQRYGVPTVIVRTVSDRVQDSLPVDFNVFLRPTPQGRGWVRDVAGCLLRPSMWVGLARLGWHGRRAAHQLTHFMRPFLRSLTERSGHRAPQT